MMVFSSTVSTRNVFAFDWIFLPSFVRTRHWYSGPGYGRVMGTQWSIAAIGGAAMPVLIGLLRDAAGGYGPALAAVAGLFVLAAVAAVLSGRSPPPD